MEKKDLTAAAAILEKFEDLFGSQTFEGIKAADKNFEGNFLLIESSTRMYSFNSNDVLDEIKLVGGKVRVIMRKGCTGMITCPYRVGANDVTLLSHAENSPLPAPASSQKNLRLASKKDVLQIKRAAPAPRTLAAVAANWANKCALNESEKENCAHYLSDAFINAGFVELKKSAADASINEWCDWNDTKKDGNARPVRAKEMWAWFQRMATKTKKNKPSKEGFWAVFQWDPSYSGGHVLLYDSDADKVYGTNVFWQWKDQFFYQWQ